VQDTLERAIAAVTQEKIKVVASGRTDAGAHALAQVIAFSTRSALPTHVLARAVNAHLPGDVAVTDVSDVPPDFHPRYDALLRAYRYLIWNRPVRSPFMVGRAAHVTYPLDHEAMNVAAAFLRGEQDFSAFVPASFSGSRIRTIRRAECRREGELVALDLEGTGFLRQMVRSIAGTLVEVGSGKLQPAAFRDILLSRDRRRAGRTMPACGLYLREVIFPSPAADQPVDGQVEGIQEQA
jgi:tRNA pseudouridine38-40 synthase